jgi:hypothetical protein
LRRNLFARIGRNETFSRGLEKVFANRLMFRVLLRALTLVDSRPGRLYSFIADKR